MFKTINKGLAIRLICTVVFVTVPAYLVFNIFNRNILGTDDADIILVYARNFIHGHGFVYNIGGEHVEGFSCMLYVFICGLFYLITDSPQVLVLVYNLIIAIASSYLIVDVLKRLAQKYKIPALNTGLLYWIYFVWLLINPLYFAWLIVTMMDAGTYSFLLILTYWYFIITLFHDRAAALQSKVVPVFIFLILICRPEGLFWGVVFLLIHFLLNYSKQPNVLAALKKVRYSIASYVITIASLTIFRLVYFGYPLPNTYYSKVSASLKATLTDGASYFLSFLNMYGFLIAIPIVICTAWVAYKYLLKKESGLIVMVALITILFILAGLAFPIIEGGDHFPGFRFYQNIYPLLILPFILLLFVFTRIKSFGMVLLSGIAMISLLSFFNQASWAKFIRNNNVNATLDDNHICLLIEFNIAKTAMENGRRLNDVFEGDLPVIGYGSAGGIAFTYKGFIYDMMGLNDTHFAHADAIKIGPKAHQSFNKKVYYQLAPDILQPTAVLSSEQVSLADVNAFYTNPYGWDNMIFKGIFNDSEFKQTYVLAVVYNSEHPQYACYGYFNSTYLQKLTLKGNFRIKKYSY